MVGVCPKFRPKCFRDGGHSCWHTSYLLNLKFVSSYSFNFISESSKEIGCLRIRLNEKLSTKASKYKIEYRVEIWTVIMSRWWENERFGKRIEM